MSRYIDAEKLMKVLEEDIPITNNPVEVMASAIAALEEQTPADVRENVKGEWLQDRLVGWLCSSCREHIVLDINKYGKFCPNCGADMRGEV